MSTADVAEGAVGADDQLAEYVKLNAFIQCVMANAHSADDKLKAIQTISYAISNSSLAPHPDRAQPAESSADMSGGTAGGASNHDLFLLLVGQLTQILPGMANTPLTSPGTKLTTSTSPVIIQNRPHDTNQVDTTGYEGDNEITPPAKLEPPTNDTFAQLMESINSQQSNDQMPDVADMISAMPEVQADPTTLETPLPAVKQELIVKQEFIPKIEEPKLLSCPSSVFSCNRGTPSFSRLSTSPSAKLMRRSHSRDSVMRGKILPPEWKVLGGLERNELNRLMTSNSTPNQSSGIMSGSSSSDLRKTPTRTTFLRLEIDGELQTTSVNSVCGIADSQPANTYGSSQFRELAEDKDHTKPTSNSSSPLSHQRSIAQAKCSSCEYWVCIVCAFCKFSDEAKIHKKEYGKAAKRHILFAKSYKYWDYTVSDKCIHPVPRKGPAEKSPAGYFKRRCDMVRHMRSQHKDDDEYMRYCLGVLPERREYTCNQCDYKTPRSHYLEIHLQTHKPIGERKFVCQYYKNKINQKVHRFEYRKINERRMVGGKIVFVERVARIYEDDKDMEKDVCGKRCGSTCDRNRHHHTHDRREPSEGSDLLPYHHAYREEERHRIDEMNKGTRHRHRQRLNVNNEHLPKKQHISLVGKKSSAPSSELLDGFEETHEFQSPRQPAMLKNKGLELFDVATAIVRNQKQPRQSDVME